MPTLDDVMNKVADIEKNISGTVKELSETVDTMHEDIEQRGGVMTDTNKKIDALEEDIRKFHEEREELKSLATEVEMIQKYFGRGGSLGSGDPEESKSIGQSFSESEALKSYVARGARGTSDSIETTKSITGMARKAGTITNADTGWGGVGALIQPFELGEIIEDPRRQFFVRDLLRVIPVDSDAVHFAEETGFAPLYVELTAVAAAAATTITVENVNGMFVGQSIQVNEVNTHTITAINATTNVVTISPAVPGGGYAVGAAVTSFQLAMIPHGGQKPQGSIKFADKTLPIGTIADWIAIHRQTLQDARQVQAMIDTRLRYGLALAEEDQLLFGNGSAPNLTGIMVNANVQNQGTMPATPDVSNNFVQHIDWIRKAVTKAEIAGYPVNGVILHPTAWETIELLKDNERRYIYFNIAGTNQRRLFAIPIVSTTVMPANRFLAGAFALGAYLFDREQANVRVSESHDKYFTQNMVAILAEQREGLGVVRPEAFIKGQFS